MELGCFSVSIAVKDLEKSKLFYQKLGFAVFAGDQAHNYLIMKNGDTNIGLFQGMFENNILTFNPGWDQEAQNLQTFTDIRQVQQHLINQGIDIVQNAVSGESGPANFSVIDPDGNAILFDQHV